METSYQYSSHNVLAVVSRHRTSHDYWKKSEWTRFYVIQKLDIIGNSFEGSCSKFWTIVYNIGTTDDSIV